MHTMKALTTPSGNFGPFKQIEVLADRYRADNTDLPFTVVGQGEIVEADTITWPATPAVVDPNAYKARRAAEYPPAADYLDGIVKGDTAQVQAYIAACLAVKAKYPKT